MNIASAPRRKGLVNWPGITYSSKILVESLLAKDAREHHCYFSSGGFHNHLNHHVLSAYDLGAPPGLLQKIYDQEAGFQRPIYAEEQDKEIIVTKENWTKHLGDQHAYGAYFKFFSEIVQDLGVLKAVEQYIFADSANGDDAQMLIRLVGGALHPFIDLGYGLEFGSDIVVAAGLAMTAVTKPLPPQVYDIKETTSGKNDSSRGPSVLEILKQVYDSDILKPIMPYDPDALFRERIRGALSEGRADEIKRICSQFSIGTSASDQEFDARVEEIMWTVTLLLCATGRPGRKPRLDFFLMHLVTSSLFLQSYLRVLQDPVHKANLLRAYLPGLIVITLARGRPRIDPELLMSYTATPRPPTLSLPSPREGAIGDPRDDGDYNPWSAMVQSVLHASGSHVLKTMRTLVYAAQKYGDTRPGGAIGAFSAKDGKETHNGMAKVDGTIFVRAAGMLVDYIGWIGHGEAQKRDWDRSALGWDDAWKDGE